jgi:hypothetical protein
MSLEMGSLVGTVVFVTLCGGALVIRHIMQTRKFNDHAGPGKPERR